MAKNDESHEIRLPESILELIDEKKYENDERFAAFSNGKKRKEKRIPRKEQRQQERLLKKQKRSNGRDNKAVSNKTTSAPKRSENKPVSKTSNESIDDPLAQLAALKSKKKSAESSNSDPLAQLAALKNKKSSKKSDSGIRIVKEDDLQDDDISEEEFNEDDFEEFAEEDEADEFGDEISDEEDVMAKLKALKKKKSTNSLDVRIVKQDDLSDLDDNELSFAEDDDEDISIDEDDFDEDDFEDEEEELEEEEDPLAKLKALKELKKAGKAQQEDALTKLKSTKEAKKAAKDKDQKHSSKKETRVLSLQEQEMLRRDEEDIAYYAKKLGLKNGAKSKLTKEDDNDIIGGLLDGLEFDLYDDYSEPGSESNDEEADPIKELKSIKEAKKAKKEPKVPNSHEELLRRDEEDIAYYAKKLGLKNGSKSKLTKIDDDDEIGGLLDGLDLDFGDEVSEEEEQSEDEEDEDLGSESEEEVKEKENPFVAPVEKSEGESKYIPPALRRKLALENNSVSEEVLRLRKEIKSALNKLSESNISTIVNSINELYLNNPRQMINEELTTIVLDSVIQQGRLLDTFVYLHASLVVAIHRLQGVEFGAYFIQTLIEKFEGAYKDTSKSKESSNMVSLISSVYLFQLISSKLIYDIIKNLIKDLNENNADLLLRLIRSSGNQMRSDDPNSLKEIIIEMNKSVSNVLQDKLTTRTQFLIETISSLKNNKLKVSNEINHQLSIRLKKFLATINNNKLSDPIQVSLEDIHSVETRGKWWLVGSAWKGHSNDDSNSNVNELVMNDILDQADPNWMELARAQRMNTDIRRAIFVSIMSASDYIDAVTKLDKLALKRSQEREIPRVLLQCAGVEPAWNPYYGILAKKLCELHSYRKTFQFMLWDLIKDLEGSADDEDDFLGFDNSEDNEDDKLKRTLNLGRFYGFLISEGCLPLHILRTVNFLTANTNTVLFMEVLFVTILDKLGKKSQVRLVGLSRGSKEMKFEDKLLIEMILKAKEQQTLLRGIQYFLQEKVRTSDIIDGKKQRTRVEWGVNAFIDIIDELAKSDRD